MSNKLYDDFIDDIPSLVEDAHDEADAAFWDEFMLLESSAEMGEDSYTITIENEVTGERTVVKHVRLKKRTSL